VVQVPSLPPAEQAQWIEQRSSQEQGRLHLSSGPLARALLFRLAGTQPARLLLVCHHLIIDTVSWRIVLQELSQSYERLCQELPLLPLPTSSSYQEWAQCLLDYVQTDAMQQQAAFWLNQALPPSSLPLDEPTGGNQEAWVENMERHLSVQDTQALLHQVPQRMHASVEEMLLAALALACSDCFGSTCLAIDLEGHGREALVAQLDLSGTIGWFTSLFPLRLEVGLQPEPLAALRTIKSLLRRIPQRGISYGLLRYLHPDPQLRASLQEQPQPAISFNYLGQFDQVLGSDALFSLAPESPGRQQDPQNQRMHQLDIVALVVGEQLHLSLQYGTQLHHAQTMLRLTQSYLARLQHLIALAQAAQGSRCPYIPEDFPLLQVSQAGLDRLLTQIQASRPWASNVVLEELYPLAGMQAGLLFHSQAAGEQGLYTEHVSFQVEGPFRPAAFVDSWRHLLAAHPVLRTSFVGEEVLAQAVWQSVPLPLVVMDVTGLSQHERDQQVRAYQQADARRSFVLQEPPLLRVAVVRVGTQHHQVLWSFHHAILDGWSVSLLLRELFARYQARVQATEPDLPACRPYRDYIAWLLLQDQQAAEAFWSDELQGLTAPTPLPLTTTHSLTQPSYGQQKVQLSKEVSQHLLTVARQLHITLNTLIQASWAWVLSRYSGQSEVLFGMVVAGRPAELVGVESLVGLCINTVPVRLSIPRAGTVADWLGQVHAHLARVQHYSYYPLWQIQRISQLDPAQALFQSIVAFENYPVEQTVQQMQHSDLRISPWLEQEVQERTNYPLAALALPGDQVQLAVSYQHQAIDAQVVSSMLHLWQQVLHALVAQPEQSLVNLPLVSQTEGMRLLEWNATERSYAQGVCVHELFEQQAQQQPDAIALVQAESHLSYGELDQRANQVAHRLQRQGVGPESLVGVCLPRSLELVIAQLAVLKAGGAYVPLEPSLPQERLCSQLHAAHVSLVLTDVHLGEALAACHLPVLCLDGDENLFIQQPTSQPQRRVQPEHLAYVIYTSGSTGHPKGVMITQTSLTNLVCWHLAAFEVGATDRVTQVAGLGFDASVWELWPALVAGASITLLEDAAHLAPEQLGTWLAKHAITVSFVPTPLAEPLVAQPWARSCTLRVLLTGGDRLHHRPERVLPFQLINNYGPTEATVVATSGAVTTGEATGQSAPDIGRAIANTQLYVLNERMQPVPIGVEGELYVGGVPLARGYLGRAELTAERFVPHPFSSIPGARLYRTGDLVCWLPDGRLAFVGRNDSQVKVRGYRIELGEIEQTLLRHVQVREAVVVAREDAGGSKQVVAYVVPAQQQPAQWSGQLRCFLAQRLPDYMLPSHIVVLEALPLTTNGKVDRQALLAHKPEEGTQQQPHEQQRPRDQIELQLLHIWERVLETGPISLTDNFFHLGGHSLTALRLQSQVQSDFQRQLPLGLLLQHPTIRELAHILRQQIGYVRGPSLVPLQPHGSHAPFFCVHPGGGSVFCYLDLVRHLGMSYPVYGLQAPEVEEGQAIASVQQLAAHYIAALQTVQPEGPYLLGGWSAGGIIAYEMACQLRYQGHDVALLCLFDSRVPSVQQTRQRNQALELTAFLVASGFHEQEVSCLTEEEQLRVAYEVFKRELMLPDGLDLAYVQHFMQIQFDIEAAIVAYEPPRSDQHITLVRVEQAMEHTAVRQNRELERDSTYGWSEVTTVSVDVHRVPGTHNEMFREPYVKTVASTLRACLEKRV
jgi:amino acid adenylation domain-containing protein/non-ribosomal peptide synthase protein (TIGR01720 family)